MGKETRDRINQGSKDIGDASQNNGIKMQLRYRIKYLYKKCTHHKEYVIAGVEIKRSPEIHIQRKIPWRNQ